MFLHLKDSSFRCDKVIAVTSGHIPATESTGEFFTIVVHLDGMVEPLIHTYLSREERDDTFTEIKETLDDVIN